MEDKKIEKEKLRSKYLQVRKELSSKTEKSQIITTKIINTKKYKNARPLYDFLDNKTEQNVLNHSAFLKMVQQLKKSSIHLGIIKLSHYPK